MVYQGLSCPCAPLVVFAIVVAIVFVSGLDFVRVVGFGSVIVIVFRAACMRVRTVKIS